MDYSNIPRWQSDTPVHTDEPDPVREEKMIENAGDRKSRMIAYDIDRDGIDELFIYGARNFVIGLDAKLEMLPGFPVAGGRKPAFGNLNNDAWLEMIVAGFDDKLYVYELSK
mgnify:CR=1 FL=1